MNKVDLSTFDNDNFQTAGFVKRILWYFVNVLFFINPIVFISSIKVTLLRLFGAQVGQGVVIKPGVNIKYPWLLSIGDNVWIGENVWVDNLCKVEILDNVCISQGAMLLTGNHDYKKSTFDLMTGKISLEEGAWVGARSTVCPGVTLETHAILSVGSIATKDLEAYKIYSGVPATFVRDRVIV